MRKAALTFGYPVRLMRALRHLARGRIGTRRAATVSASSHTEWSRFSSLTRRASSSVSNNSQASGLSAQSLFALRGRCHTSSEGCCGRLFVMAGASEVSFCSKSGTQFLLPVDFHGVGGIARNPANSHGMAAQQTHPQGFDMFGVPARVGVKGAARNPIPAHGVDFAVALSLTGSGEQHGKPDGDRFARVGLRQLASNGPGAGTRADSQEMAGGIAIPAIRTGHGTGRHPPPGDVQPGLFPGSCSRWFQPVCLHPCFSRPFEGTGNSFSSVVSSGALTSFKFSDGYWVP